MSTGTVYGFTKIVVDDLDRIADFYTKTVGYKPLQRVKAVCGGEDIEEIIMVLGEGYGEGIPLIVWKWLEREAPADTDAILGFQTDDVDALYQRVLDNGGTGMDEPHDQLHHGVRVGFAKDPDGRVLELVQMLGS